MKPFLKRVHWAIPLLCAIPLGVGYTCYGCYTFTGLYRWVAETNRKTDGTYDPAAPFGVSVWVASAMAWLVLLGVAWCADQWWSALSPAPVRAPRSASSGAIRFVVYAVFGGSGMLALAISAVMFWMALNPGPAVPVDVAVFEVGKPPSNRHVRVSGMPLAELARGVTEEQERGGQTVTSHTTWYVPVVSGNWRPGQPIAVYLEVPDGRRFPPTRTTYEGITYRHGLPALARMTFDRVGPIPARDYVVVKLGGSMSDEEALGVGGLALGTVLLGVPLIGEWSRGRARRRAAVSQRSSPLLSDGLVSTPNQTTDLVSAKPNDRPEASP